MITLNGTFSCAKSKYYFDQTTQTAKDDENMKRRQINKGE